jgi:hypothetical protein
VVFGLHPLIHTLLGLAQAQDVEKKKEEPQPPHFLCLSQDIVVWSQRQKCRLKYVIHSPRVLMEDKKAEPEAPRYPRGNE